MAHRSPNVDKTPLRNKCYRNDVHYALQMCQWLLKLIGVWPLVYGRTSKLDQLVALILMTVCFSSLLFIILPCGHHVFFVDKSVQTKLKMLGPVGFCASNTIKYFYLGLRGDIFERCIQRVERDWKYVEDPSHRSIMLKYARISRKLTTICAAFLFTGGMSFHTVMQFMSKDRSKSNSTFKPLAYPGLDSFFNARVSPTYEILFLAHCFGAMIMYSISTAAYSMAAIIVTHICGQVQIQITRLEDLVGGKKKRDDDRDPFAVIIQNHAQILRLAKDVEEAMREICLTEIVESTLSMCMLEYYCLMEWRANNTVAIFTFSTLLISFTFNIFIFCYIGEMLSEQCSRIGTVSYEIEWYNLPSKRAHDLLLLNVISQFPPKLTAGKIIELSFNTFGTVVKTSVVYLNLLRTVTNW